MVSMNEDRVCVRAGRRFALDFKRRGNPFPKERTRTEEENEPWRRITSMTREHERFMDARERKAGLRALVEWIEEAVRRHTARARARNGVARYGVEGEMLRAEEARMDEWACEGQSRELVVWVCGVLNISRHKLSELTAELRGISCTELIDGLRARKVKGALRARIEELAKELWLEPGDYACVLASDERLRIYGGGKGGGKGSAYFVDPDAEWRRAELYETRIERREALLKLFDASWRRGEASKDAFAMELGFRSFSELNRACLNFYGRSARQLAWEAIGEVVEYYLAREQEELRELACCDSESPRVLRARYLYHDSTEKPTGASAEVSPMWEAWGMMNRDG